MIDSVSNEGEQGASRADLKKGKRVKPALRRADPAVDIERLPPSSIESEQAIFGSVFQANFVNRDSHEVIDEVVSIFKGRKEAFYDLRHQTIWETMCDLRDKGGPIDAITVMQHLKDRNLLEQVGGLVYLSNLSDCGVGPSSASYYAEIVLEKFTLRQIVYTCTDAVARVYDYEGEVDQLVDEIERDIMNIRPDSKVTDAVAAGDLINETLNTIEAYQNRTGVLTGLPTGFSDLDKMTSGLQPGDMIVIAARPSIGKTSLAMNIADTVALDYQIPTGVFSLEMTKAALMLRMVASRARVNLKNITDGFLAERDFPKITGVAGRIKKAPLYIDDSSSLSVMELRAKARRMVKKWGVKLIVVDYLQLLNSNTKRARDNRTQEVTEISNGIKAMCKELNIPVIVLCQLNREMEKGNGQGRRPKMSDIRESGAIEQDADFVGLLYKANQKDDDENTEEESDALAVNLLVAKQRNGPTGIVHLTFLKSYTRFENAAKVSDQDLPN